MNKAECPDFDYFDFEKILEWGKAKVAYTDTVYHVKTKTTRKLDEKHCHWTLIWHKGFIGFDTINKREDEEKARRASALFIYLWCKGVEASIADKCASLYEDMRNITE